ncbi:MAG: 3-hydroxyacyl-CoA dehydrogenase [Planctomycetes bacterium]|nr:3-hydroxyacyl-CoA dehydrogenase [Planctomycetota bacterium]
MVQRSVSDGVCLLRLDAPPVNSITYALLDALVTAVQQAASDPMVRGIVLAGDAEHFSAGADLDLFRETRTAEDAVRMSRVFQEALGEVEACPKPVVAAVAGKMMGCAIELAAACHYRVCARGAQFSMPEVTFGINPGAGATARLPRLIGVEHALRMLLAAAPIGAEEALAIGLVDALCSPDELIELAKEFAGQGRPAYRTRERTDRVCDRGANDTAFAAAEKQLAKGRPELVAPWKILDAVWAGVEESFDAALRKEQTGYAECMATLGTQNKLYVFFATREAGKLGDCRLPIADCRLKPEVGRVAVVGMGSMGTGIAHAFLIAGLPVVAIDEDESALERGRQRIARSVEKRVAEGKLAPDRAEKMLGLLSTTSDWAAVADADWVAEAVFEDAAVKRAVLARVEGVCRPDAVIASNTSTLSLDLLAEGMRHPQRLIGMHFFNPAHVMPLVEVIRREATPPDVIAAALRLAKTLRKTPVLVRNREGFLVNRIFIPYLKEAFWLLEEGAAAGAIDAAMAEFGFPMGPLALIDMAGLDILAATDAVLRRAFPRHGPLPGTVTHLVAQGRLGQKTGGGVYDYSPGDHTPRSRGERYGNRGISAAEITQRLVMRMVAEAFWVLGEGIAQRESDIDVAMVLGTGFPDFRGGVLKYARDLGLDHVRVALGRLVTDVGERYATPDLSGLQAR